METWSRRTVLRGAGIAAALGTFACRVALGQPAARRLDLHHHYGSPNWIRKMTNARVQGWQAFRDYTPARSIEAMDRAGVETAFISCTQPGASFTDDYAAERDDAIATAREMNEFGAQMVADHSGRFGLFAVLPLPHIDASLRELEYAFDTLRAAGVGILTSYGDRYLGDPAFAPLLEELNRRNAVVYTHPTDGPCCRTLIPGAAPITVEWQTDTARSIFSMVNDTAGALGASQSVTSPATRYPNVRFIWSHAGGSLIGLMNRIVGRENLTEAHLAREPEANSRLHHLRRFFYDTAQSHNVLQMQALKGLVGASQIVFGADYPYSTILDHVEGLRECGFTAQELAGIDRNNALRILSQRAEA